MVVGGGGYGGLSVLLLPPRSKGGRFSLPRRVRRRWGGLGLPGQGVRRMSSESLGACPSCPRDRDVGARHGLAAQAPLLCLAVAMQKWASFVISSIDNFRPLESPLELGTTLPKLSNRL
jgi:hypothetical protein